MEMTGDSFNLLRASDLLNQPYQKTFLIKKQLANIVRGNLEWRIWQAIFRNNWFELFKIQELPKANNKPRIMFGHKNTYI